MKKTLYLFVLLFTSLFTIAQTKNLSQLVGKWQIVDNNDNAAGLEIVDTAKLFLVYGDQKKLLKLTSLTFPNHHFFLNSLLRMENQQLL